MSSVESVEDSDFNVLEDDEAEDIISRLITQGINSSSITQDINSSLITLLECPVCLNYMIPPITQCMNGHNVCSVCVPQLIYCPICREDLKKSSSRNLFAEQLAQKAVFPCKNFKDGCRESFKLADMQKHTSVCPYRIYECLIMEDDCSWRGLRTELFNHVSDMHEGKAWNSELVHLKCPKEFGTTVFNINGIITAYDEVFYINLDWKENEKKMFGTVQYIGEKENSSKFKYKFVFRNGAYKVKHQHIVSAEAVDVADIHKTGKCVCIDTNLAKHFVQSNELQFILHIVEANI